jgi:hypothetical protein
MNTPTLFAPTIQDEFERFDRDHPEVYRAFKWKASQLLAAGHRRYSADAIMHAVRVEADVNAERAGGFKINNNYVSRYARKLADEDPRFAAFFRFRSLKSH